MEEQESNFIANLPLADLACKTLYQLLHQHASSVVLPGANHSKERTTPKAQ